MRLAHQIIRATAFASLALLMSANPRAFAASKACDQWADLAKKAMIGRQGGADLAQLLPTLGDQEIVKAIATKAYEQPVQASEDDRKKAVRDFVTSETLACYTTPATYELQLGG
jgi:hypothetical protein